MKRNLICIRCPLGCRLTAEWTEEYRDFNVTGNRCPRGALYAEQEIRDPKRIVTAVVKTNAADPPYIPVRTDRELPKNLIEPLLNHLYTLEIPLPVRCGDILIENYENSGVNLQFSCSAGEKQS